MTTSPFPPPPASSVLQHQTNRVVFRVVNLGHVVYFTMEGSEGYQHEVFPAPYGPSHDMQGEVKEICTKMAVCLSTRDDGGTLYSLH